VRLLGALSPADVAAVLREADVLLHASCAEGVSNAVLEAMATGLAVVTTDAGGMREAVRDEVDGLVVPVQDATAMGDALARLAADPALRRRLGASARRRVADDFHLDDQVASFVALLEEAAGAAPVPAPRGGAR
jgi:glycosyltransferase involved in cell wall biosynthesis